MKARKGLLIRLDSVEPFNYFPNRTYRHIFIPGGAILRLGRTALALVDDRGHIDELPINELATRLVMACYAAANVTADNPYRTGEHVVRGPMLIIAESPGGYEDVDGDELPEWARPLLLEGIGPDGYAELLEQVTS